MKFLKQSEFVKLPAGVFYMHYKPCVFGDLRVKGDTLTQNDWCYTSTDMIYANDSGEMMERLDEMEESGASYPLALVNNDNRHGLYDPDDSLIAVLEREDLLGLGQLILRALNVSLPLQP